MAVCRICETRGPDDGATTNGICPGCESLYSLVDTWFDEKSDTTDAGYSTVGHEDVQVLKRRLGRFFELHQAPKPMQWG